jgi:hypothetical protein
MRRHPLNILHDGDWVLEDVVIDALQDVADGLACLMEGGAIGVVDVAAAVGCCTPKFTVDLKLACYGADIVLFAHNQSLLG